LLDFDAVDDCGISPGIFEGLLCEGAVSGVVSLHDFEHGAADRQFEQTDPVEELMEAEFGCEGDERGGDAWLQSEEPWVSR
jgi:hypothetical protein